MKSTKRNILTSIFLILAISLCSCFWEKEPPPTPLPQTQEGIAYVDYNGGVPSFDSITAVAFESYSELDGLGRCGAAYACLGRELMPGEDEERDGLSSVTPSGWVQKNYSIIEDGGYLYNRCHLIGYQLAGEQANEKNLITGTRYMNIEGMLPFENMVADYIKETGNHVMYRVTPVYADTFDLVASGVIMEALSVEDGGAGISFCIYAYNIQPGIIINYRTGSSYMSGTTPPAEDGASETPSTIVINKSSKRFHLPNKSCSDKIGENNKEIRDYYDGIFEDIQKEGYTPCGTCKPLG